ncbi:hypothetical protein HPB48_017850 [Haemaphysalis longicornis]|uniref:Uncharacterized protein n=1 Tax=Haemaphysalis longicornis TaxID=44386 RepID=A0A9J6FRM4_HAELO|nr:hypothetical protein HPB48_017850 [Haemaphysalis longicornis]
MNLTACVQELPKKMLSLRMTTTCFCVVSQGCFQNFKMLQEASCSGPSGAKCVHEAIVEQLKRKLDLQQKQTRKLEKQLEAVLGERFVSPYKLRLRLLF